MSVCICLLCRDEGNPKAGQRIVFVEDRKVTFTDFSADNAVIKSDILYQDCWLQYAGDDAEKARLVIDAARLKIAATNPDTWTPQRAVELLSEALGECRDKEIEAKILRKHGFTSESFRDDGKEKCTETVYDELHDRIDRFKFSLEFIVAGFDLDGDAHVFHVDSSGAISCYDDLGFWAIGSGAHAALSSLSFHIEHNDLCSYCSCVHNTVYFGCEAKFMAETSVKVGKDSTFVSVHKWKEEVPLALFQDGLEKIKKGWLKYGAPQPSQKVMLQIHDLLEKENGNDKTKKRKVKRSNSRKSVDQK